MQSRGRSQRTQDNARRKGAQHRIQIKESGAHDKGREQEHRKTQNRLAGRIGFSRNNLAQTRQVRKQAMRNQSRHQSHDHECQ